MLSQSGRRLGQGLSLLVAMMLASCTAVPRATELSIAPGAQRPVAAQIDNYQDAVDAIVSVMTQELDIAMPSTSFTVYFYPHRDAFAQGLSEKFHKDPAVAREIASSSLGRMRQTTEGKQLLVNEESLDALKWTERLHVLAHEITHIVQYEFSGGRLAGELWLVEGAADWIAYRVLEALGLDTLSRRKQQKIAKIKHESEHQPLPPLARMSTVADWDALSARDGGLLPYAQAFLATDLLVQQHGLAAILAYFQHVSHSTSRRETFLASFGQSPTSFEHDFDVYVERLLSAPSPESAALAPDRN